MTEKEVLKYVKMLNKACGHRGGWNYNDISYRSQTDFNKFYKKFKGIYLTVGEVKKVIAGEKIKVIEPQEYHKLSTLTHKKIEYSEDDPLGIFTGPSKQKDKELATTGSGSDPWIVANEKTLEILELLVEKEGFVDSLKERRKEYESKKNDSEDEEDDEEEKPKKKSTKKEKESKTKVTKTSKESKAKKSPPKKVKSREKD